MPDTTPAASTAKTETAAPAPARREENAPRQRRRTDVQLRGWWWGTGRRKSACARVRLKPGTGEIKVQVNRRKMREADEYFKEMRDREDVKAPLKITNTLGKVDVIVRLKGGGFMGQAQATRLGIARALKSYDPTLESALRDAGFLTRDPREVERKKYGQAGARRRFQFSKR